MSGVEFPLEDSLPVVEVVEIHLERACQNEGYHRRGVSGSGSASNYHVLTSAESWDAGRHYILAPLQLNKVAQPRVIPNGYSVETANNGLELIVKDHGGKTVGTFKAEAVSGWWIEGIPLDVSHLTDEDLDSLMRSVGEHRKAN